MKIPYFTAACVIAVTLLSAGAYANGLTLSGTRLIYDATKKEASITLNHSGKGVPHLVQSWVSDVNQKTDNIPFIITPPLSKLAPDSSVPVRVVNVGHGTTALPSDRESLFLLHVRAVPATEKMDNPQRITLAIQNTIKLIYRPAGLSSRESTQAVDKLTASTVSGGVRFDNPTAYVVTLTSMSINGKQIERPGVVMPFASMTVPFTTGKATDVSFRAINDFGGTTPVRAVKL